MNPRGMNARDLSTGEANRAHEGTPDRPNPSPERGQTTARGTRGRVSGEAAGGAPAVKRRTPRGAPARTSAGALAMLISTVGAAQNMVICSSLMSW